MVIKHYTYCKKIQKLDKLQRIMSYSVPHKLSARIAFDMGETWLGSVTREVFLRLYKDGQEYEIRNIPELKTWLTKFKDISNPSVELDDACPKCGSHNIAKIDRRNQFQSCFSAKQTKTVLD